MLLELAEDYGRRTPGGLELAIRLSHQDLASVIGSTRETVTLVLGKLQVEGLLRLQRRRITLTDATRLAASVSADPSKPARQSLAAKVNPTVAHY